jgi:hypothetical protein
MSAGRRFALGLERWFLGLGLAIWDLGVGSSTATIPRGVASETAGVRRP